MIQVTSPSASDNPELATKVSELVDHINVSPKILGDLSAIIGLNWSGLGNVRKSPFPADPPLPSDDRTRRESSA
jgi:hypothetical protein